VGGVDSMMAERKPKKSSLHRFLQEMLQFVVLVEEISCTRFYSRKKNQIATNDMCEYQIFRERGLDSALHRKRQKRL